MATRSLMPVRIGTALAVVVLGFVLVIPATTAAATKTRRASVTSAGAQSGGFTSGPAAISANGRYVAFESDADDLVAHDSNDTDDIFVHDRISGKTKRVSVRSSGVGGDGESEAAAISASGRYVAFESDARLVKHDTNQDQDIFVHDRVTGRTERISVRSSGAQAGDNSGRPSISADGRFVAFESDASDLVKHDTLGFQDVFVHDRDTGRTTRVSISSGGSEANGESAFPSISASGRFVAFESDATNLVADDTLGFRDVFVHDRKTGKTSRVSVRSGGTEGDGPSGHPAISATGRLVAFESDASNLVAGDTLGFRDVFVRDRRSGITRRVSLRSDGADGEGESRGAAISREGRYVAFVSDAPNLVPQDTKGFADVFVHDRSTGQTTRESVRSNGAEADGDSSGTTISDEGRFVAFGSFATNLVTSDTNTERDAFWRGPS